MLRHSLARLSREYGEVIDLVYYHGRSVKEVTQIVGTEMLAGGWLSWSSFARMRSLSRAFHPAQLSPLRPGVRAEIST